MSRKIFAEKDNYNCIVYMSIQLVLRYFKLFILFLLTFFQHLHLASKELKTHIGDNWVCGTETSDSTPTPNFISLRYIVECGLSRSNGQAHNLKLWTVASDLPWTLSRVCLPVEPALFAFSKTVHEKDLIAQVFARRSNQCMQTGFQVL